MIEVAPRLYVGSADDYEEIVAPDPDGWAVVHACKEPYHREAVGYTTRAAPREDPEYLFAHRDPRRLMLNLVDATDPAFIPKPVIDEALHFIFVWMMARERVLIHCNQGRSRAPSIALLYLRTYCTTDVRWIGPLDAVIEMFRGIYPGYAPAAGMVGYLKENWP